MAAVVQIFYAYRIKILGNSYLIPSVVVLVSFKIHFIFMHLEWLVLICVVGITSTRRRNRTRYSDREDALFIPAVKQEDTYSSWRMCSEFFPRGFNKITNSYQIIGLVWK